MKSIDRTLHERRLLIEVRGVVQGVGFRPFVFGLARRLAISGSVRNEADTVRIEAQGASDAVENFLHLLKSEAPSQSKIERIDIREVECRGQKVCGFEILASAGQSAPRPTIPPDLATCPDCLAEIHGREERRFGYAFTNCTNCGPRWSIISGLPYDRPRTSMESFTMCDDCRKEYGDPSDRRFHAQPIACPVCGPKLRFLSPDGQPIAETGQAMQMAVDMICGGQIVAVKGLGGFQLVADATSTGAVARLRAKKHRPDKPFALMATSVAEAEQFCEISEPQRQLLESAAAPIVLLRKRTADTTDNPNDGGPNKISAGVAPGNPFLGVMLPYTPLHHLLMESVGHAVVCTSGNFSEEPMATSTAEAVARLGAVADGLLVHNRPIVRPVDDSVARVAGKSVQILRRARGYAPQPIRLNPAEQYDCDAASIPTVLAVGGHLKNTIALKLASQVIVGSHIGDLDNIESVDVHRRAIDDLLEFFKAKPDAVACDLHPDYASSRYAELLAERWGVPLVRVQHHHAHVAACAAEHGLSGPVLGLAWDGTGYGMDKTIWGGEAFLYSNDSQPGDTDAENSPMGFTRIAHLRTFGLPSGDLAARRPRRSALGALFEIGTDEAHAFGRQWFETQQLNPLMTMLARGSHCPKTSSMGRLFDAVAAICELPKTAGGVAMPEISFEGQAAMALEFAADSRHDEAYEFPLSDGQPAVADWRPAVCEAIAGLKNGLPIGIVSARFHNGLARLALSIAKRAGCSQIVLTGGCFQNDLLSSRVQTLLSQAGFNVYAHSLVPPGDGGICLGQAVVAARRQ